MSIEYKELNERYEHLLSEASSAGGDRKDPILERSVLSRALGTFEDQEKRPARIRIHVTIFRKRLLDDDNAHGGVKYLVDCLRYAGAIPQDTPGTIELTASQEKVQGKDCVESAVIEVWYPDEN